MKFRLKNRCDWLLYFTGSVIETAGPVRLIGAIGLDDDDDVIETGSFRIAIKQNARVKNMKMSL